MRAEAIAVLGVWPNPSPLDRVDGFYIGTPRTPGAKPTQTTIEKRDAAAARTAVLQLVQATAKDDGHPTLKVALADAARRLELREAGPILWAQVQKDPSPDVRLAGLRALQVLKAPNIAEVMKTALADADPAVRRAALDILPTLPLTDAAKVRHLESLVKRGSVEEKQGALDVLGRMDSRVRASGAGRVLRSAGRRHTAVRGAHRPGGCHAGDRLRLCSRIGSRPTGKHDRPTRWWQHSAAPC